MRVRCIVIGISIVIILLLVGVLYFLDTTQRLDYEILIGVPVEGENNEIGGVDLTESIPLKEEYESDIVIFSLLDARECENVENIQRFPDAIVWIGKPDAVYVKRSIWIEDDSIILGRLEDEATEYEIVENQYYAEELTEIIREKIQIYDE